MASDAPRTRLDDRQNPPGGTREQGSLNQPATIPDPDPGVQFIVRSPLTRRESPPSHGTRHINKSPGLRRKRKELAVIESRDVALFVTPVDVLDG